MSSCIVRGEAIDGDPIVRVLARDKIRSIDDPQLISATEADRIMSDATPVLGLAVGKVAHAYSLWELENHEVVNDRLGQLPVAATW